MCGREELKLYWGGATLDFDVYKKAEADNVLDAMEKQIRTLENDKEEMYESNLVLQARIKELESQLPKWIAVKDRLPTEDGEYQVVYKLKNGGMLSTFDEWDNDYKFWCAAETSVVVYWAELLPLPPEAGE